MCCSSPRFVFFFNDPSTTEIYTLSLHDALPISVTRVRSPRSAVTTQTARPARTPASVWATRSEEHTSELQSHSDIVCRLLLEKKKKTKKKKKKKKKKTKTKRTRK